MKTISIVICALALAACGGGDAAPSPQAEMEAFAESVRLRLESGALTMPKEGPLILDAKGERMKPALLEQDDTCGGMPCGGGSDGSADSAFGDIGGGTSYGSGGGGGTTVGVGGIPGGSTGSTTGCSMQSYAGYYTCCLNSGTSGGKVCYQVRNPLTPYTP